MKFELAATLLSLVAVQATALPEPGSDGMEAAAPRMIKPKYRSTAKRAIVRAGPFTLKAKGVSNKWFTVKERANGNRLQRGRFQWTPMDNPES
jgi:hypothetical protein